MNPWTQLLQLTLRMLGCDVPPTPRVTRLALPPFDHVDALSSAKLAKPVKIYYDVEENVVRRQLQLWRERQTTRDYTSTVATAFSALCIPEGNDCMRGAQRLLPDWYRTRPKVHRHMETPQARRGANELGQIDAVVVARPPKQIGLNGKITAREPCRAQFILRNADGHSRACRRTSHCRSSTPIVKRVKSVLDPSL